MTPEFFARHSIAELASRSEYWLNEQGRITHPMIKRPGATHYEPIDWSDAYALIGRELQSLDPDEAIFYTSGRASNEAAFAYQLFVGRTAPTTCRTARTCATSRQSIALAESIGIGKPASVVFEDIHEADLIVLQGHNPGTNHPRMLTHLEEAKKRGAKILSINPLKEGGPAALPEPTDPEWGDRPGDGSLRLPPADQARWRSRPPARRAASAMWKVTVVLPTPPFWLQKA
ncbi:molybdopterin-dependent oxidoreductase [Rhodococcus hoagii]|nr:molybdopterin-dependent oxidoreductase [Prescottella equi]